MVASVVNSSFNSRTLGRVRQEYPQLQLFAIGVSIHAPWEGCDRWARQIWRLSRVSIHAPWEGCDTHTRQRRESTASFNSRTLGRVRQADIASTEAGTEFQFTHPGKGATGIDLMTHIELKLFQFTHPGKGATQSPTIGTLSLSVSIHAPWEGCDATSCNL